MAWTGRPDRRQKHPDGGRARALVTLLCLVSLLASCGPEPQTTRIDLGRVDGVGHLMGMLVSAEPLHVLPTPQWTPEESPEAWKIHGRITMIISSQQEPAEDLIIRLTPDEPTARLHLQPIWNDVPLTPESLTSSESGLVVTVPAASLTAGTHRLDLRRDFASDSPESREIRIYRFTSIELEHGARGWRLEPSDAEALELMSRFLTYGVTGSTIQRLGGCLIQGRAEIIQQIDTPEPCSLSLDVEHIGDAPGRLEIAVGSTVHSFDLEPRAPSPIHVPIPAGAHQLALRAGEALDDLTLLGSPWLDKHDKPDRGHDQQAGTPVILISLDTTRRDALSPFGGPELASPAIAELAERATVFTNAHATAPWTLPSHASMMTGLYPLRHLAGVLRDHLLSSHLTLADVLTANGYLAAGLAGGELCSSRWGLGQGFHRYRDPEGFETRGDRLVDAALEVLHRYQSSRIFLFVNLFDPHAMYEAPPEYQALFEVESHRSQLGDLPLWHAFAHGDRGVWARIIEGEAAADERAHAFLRAAYLAEVAFMDAQVGRLVKGLEELELYDRSLIILVGDHGELLGEHGFYSHACRLDSELTEVPLIIKWPHQRTAETDNQLVSQIDLFRTVVEVTGIELGPEATLGGDGLSLARVAADGAGPDLSAREHLLMEEHELNIHPLFDNMKIAKHLFGLQRSMSREIFWSGGIECEQLDSSSGWSESPCSASWRDRLSLIAELGDSALVEPDAEHETEAGGLSQEDAERLRALGYLR